MKHDKVIIGVGILLAVWGCQSPSTQRNDQGDSITTPEVGYSLQGKVNTVQHQGMKVVGKKDTVSFDLAKPGCVKISLLVPKDSGNIRINQLVMPNCNLPLARYIQN